MFRPKKCMTCGGKMQKGGSVYDYMESKGMDGSYANRKKLFNNLFQGKYSGTAEQNIQLLQMLQQGKTSLPTSSVTRPKPTEKKQSKVTDVSKSMLASPKQPTTFGLESTTFKPGPSTFDRTPITIPTAPASLRNNDRAVVSSTSVAKQENIKRVPRVDKPTIPEQVMGIAQGFKQRVIDKAVTSIENYFGKDDTSLKVKDTGPKKEQNKIPYGYTQLGAVRDPRGAKTDSLVSFRNIFDNDNGGRYLVGHSQLEKKSDVIDNAEGVAHFIMDGDILPGQQFTNPYVTSKGQVIGSSVPGKFINAGNSGNPEQIVMGYKPNQDGSYNIIYRKNKEITPEEKKSFTFDLSLRGHPYSQINWDGEGKETGFKAHLGQTRYVPLKNGQNTSIPYLEKDDFDRFSGGSGIYTFRDPETGKRVGVDVAGSVDVIRGEGQKLIEQYKINPDSLNLLYHDMGSYSAKPKAKDGKLNYEQWRNYNTYNRGRSGAPIVIPKQQLGGLTFDYRTGRMIQNPNAAPIANIKLPTNVERDPIIAATPGLINHIKKNEVLTKTNIPDMVVNNSKGQKIGDYKNEEFVPSEETHEPKFNPYFTMRAATVGLEELSGRVERKRQDQYMYNQFSTLGQMNPMPYGDYQPNPFSLYAKFGGSIKNYMKK